MCKVCVEVKMVDLLTEVCNQCDLEITCHENMFLYVSMSKLDFMLWFCIGHLTNKTCQLCRSGVAYFFLSLHR